jgi:hypothetical protein
MTWYQYLHLFSRLIGCYSDFRSSVGNSETKRGVLISVNLCYVYMFSCDLVLEVVLDKIV